MLLRSSFNSFIQLLAIYFINSPRKLEIVGSVLIVKGSSAVFTPHYGQC